MARPFKDTQIDLVETFADQAAIALENVRLFAEVQQRTEELSELLQQQIATADVLKVISRSAFDLQIVLQTLVEFGSPPLRGRQLFISRREGPIFPCWSHFRFLRRIHGLRHRPSDRAGTKTSIGGRTIEGKLSILPT